MVPADQKAAADGDVAAAEVEVVGIAVGLDGYAVVAGADEAVVNEESLEPLKQCIRDHTDNFRKIKGGMFSRSISDYEGTF